VGWFEHGEDVPHVTRALVIPKPSGVLLRDLVGGYLTSLEQLVG